MPICPCDSNKDYNDCCGAFISGEKIPQTPEELMRSRYTAYTRADIAYIKATMQGKAAVGFDEAQAKRWAQRVKWAGLRVIQSSLQDPNHGQVEFIASFIEKGQRQIIHEKSDFYKAGDRWFYVDGQPQRG